MLVQNKRKAFHADDEKCIKVVCAPPFYARNLQCYQAANTNPSKNSLDQGCVSAEFHS
jgi:hypothetical protein